MSKTSGVLPDPPEFSFKDWLSKFNGGLEFQTHEKIFKQTIYNVIGIFLMISGCLALYGAFMVLNPFLKPLLWALLCGSVLYPFKVRVSRKLERGINSLSKPSIVHVIADGVSYPFLVYNHLSDFLCSFAYRNSIPVTIIIVVSCVHFMAPQFSLGFLWKIYHIVYFGLNVILKLGSNFFVVIPLVFTFTWMMLFRWEKTDRRLMTVLSVITWFAVLCYVTSFMDILHVPVFLGLVILFIVSYIFQYSQNEGQELLEGPSNPCTPPVCSSTPVDSPGDLPLKKKSVTGDASQDLSNLRRTISQRRKFKSQFSFVGSKSNVAASDEVEDEEHIGDQYLYWVGFACAFMFIIKWWWTPYLVGLHLFAFLGKQFFIAVGLHRLICDSWNSFTSKLSASVMNDERLIILFPAPIINLYDVILFSRTKILKILKESCDVLSTSIVLLVVIVFFIFASIFITTQIYAEGMYMVKVGHKVLNETLVFSQDNMVPESWQNHLDLAFENAYVYGRDFISKMIRKTLDGVNEDKIAELERMLLELYDRIYLAWLATTDDNTIGPKVTTDAVYQMWDSVTLNIYKTTDLFNVHMIMQFINNNMTTLSSAMRNVWEFMMDNIGLILYFIETLVSVVLVSGSTVFSFIIDIVIFMTALFYLLASSQEMYKPVEFITKVSPTYGNKLAVAIERSVTEVFMVSGKLSLFYGLYTWFLHNLFQMPIIYVPTFIAAIFASVPLLPTYVVCVPGVLDLWLLQDKSVTALCLFLLQFAPTYFVDVAIYEDIHGGHPYLTGLAMAGGVLYFGIEGAITGPLILCLLLVTMNFFASLMKEYYGPSVINESRG